MHSSRTYPQQACDFHDATARFATITPSAAPLLPAVSRIKARGDLYEMDLVLDINVDIYPVAQNDRMAVCLATTLNLDGSDMPRGNPEQQVYDTVRKYNIARSSILTL